MMMCLRPTLPETTVGAGRVAKSNKALLNLCPGLSKRTADTPTYLYYVSSVKNLTRKGWPGETTFSLVIAKDKAPTPG